MPKVIDSKKYLYAKSLLSSDLTIHKIRLKLDDIFGSSISPNTLIQMKKELEQARNERDPTKTSNLKSIFSGRSSSKREEEMMNALMNSTGCGR